MRHQIDEWSEFHSDLNLNRIYNQLANAPIGHTVEYHHRVPSTMPIVHRLAQKAEVRSGTVVIAEEQTQGKGRLQRHWNAPYGRGLLVSLLLRAPHLPAQPAQLPMVAGVALARAIAQQHPSLRDRVKLKWPNDLLITQGSACYKVAGILIETSYRDGEMDYAILGMGTNVNQTVEQLPILQAGALQPTSIFAMTNERVNRTALLIALCQQLSHYLAEPIDSTNVTAPVSAAINSDKIYKEWRALLHTLGQEVVIRNQTDDVGYRGIVEDVTPTGELMIKNDTGECRTFAFGDVTLRPSNQAQPVNPPKGILA